MFQNVSALDMFSQTGSDVNKREVFLTLSLR